MKCTLISSVFCKNYDKGQCIFKNVRRCGVVIRHRPIITLHRMKQTQVRWKPVNIHLMLLFFYLFLFLPRAAQSYETSFAKIHSSGSVIYMQPKMRKLISVFESPAQSGWHRRVTSPSTVRNKFSFGLFCRWDMCSFQHLWYYDSAYSLETL